MKYQGNTHLLSHNRLYKMSLLHHRLTQEGTKMLNLRKSSKDKDKVGWFKPDGRCKKHSKHKQSPGVCSLCLREKLTRLSIPISRAASSSSPASSSSYASSLSSSSSASSCASPLHHFPFTMAPRSSSSSVGSFFVLNGKHGLIKSRSMAVGTKKGGFWSRLLHPTKTVEEIHY